MSLKYSLLLLLGLAIVVAGKLQLPKVKKIQILKQTSEELSAQNPRNSVGCFDYYRPTLDIVTQQYEVQYNQCLVQYDANSSLEDSKWELPRQQLERTGLTSCNVLKDCSTIVGYVEAFECFAEAVRSIDSDTLSIEKVTLPLFLIFIAFLSLSPFLFCYSQGAEQSKSMYEISANATELAVQVEEFYKTLDTAKSICINNAERHYVEDTTTTYEGLNNCLSGKAPVPQQPNTLPTDQTTMATTTERNWLSSTNTSAINTSA